MNEACSPGEHKAGSFVDTSELIKRFQAAEAQLHDVEHGFENFARPIIVEHERSQMTTDEREQKGWPGSEEILDAWMDQKAEELDPSNEHRASVIMAVGLKEIIGNDKEKQEQLVGYWNTIQQAQAKVEGFRQSLREQLAEEVASVKGKINGETLIAHAMTSGDREIEEVRALIAAIYADEPTDISEFERRFMLLERANKFFNDNTFELAEPPVVFRPESRPDPLGRQFSIDLRAITRTLQEFNLRTDKLQRMTEGRLYTLQKLHELNKATAGDEGDLGQAIRASIRTRMAEILYAEGVSS